MPTAKVREKAWFSAPVISSNSGGADCCRSDVATRPLIAVARSAATSANPWKTAAGSDPVRRASAMPPVNARGAASIASACTATFRTRVCGSAICRGSGCSAIVASPARFAAISASPPFFSSVMPARLARRQLPRDGSFRTKAGAMFDNDDEKVDRRIRRTRDRLGDALLELVKEKGFDAVTVQDVLDRAQVGRSTFYEHYRDKDDLFFSDLEQFLESMGSVIDRSGEQSRRVMPVRELFSHIAGARQLYDAMVASGRIDDFTALAEGCFARAIEARLQKLAPGLDEPRLRAVALSGALLSLLRQWLPRATERSPEREVHLVSAGIADGAAIIESED